MYEIQDDGKQMVILKACSLETARLIAAAPELLEALEAALAYPQVGGAYQPWMDQARAAIARATGREVRG